MWKDEPIEKVENYLVYMLFENNSDNQNVEICINGSIKKIIGTAYCSLWCRNLGWREYEQIEVLYEKYTK